MLEKARRRYILVKINGDKPVQEKDFQSTLWSSIIRLFGEYGASLTNISLIDYNINKRYVIVCCSHRELPMVRAALATITRIGEEEATAHVLLVSGTLRALRRRMPKILPNEKDKT
ncbi:MAG: Rpp14/Pop5 family protein [Candidatus Bathyarchaeia archaeon]